MATNAYGYILDDHAPWVYREHEGWPYLADTNMFTQTHTGWLWSELLGWTFRNVSYPDYICTDE